MAVIPSTVGCSAIHSVLCYLLCMVIGSDIGKNETCFLLVLKDAIVSHKVKPDLMSPNVRG